MLTVADIKTVLTISTSTTGEDASIQNIIDFSYAQIPLIYDAASGTITDFLTVNDQSMVYLRCKMNGITIKSIDYWTGTAWATESTISNMVPYERNAYYYPTQNGRRIKVVYTATKMEEIMDEVVKDICIYNIMKQYNKDKAAYNAGWVLGSDVNAQFRTQTEVYDNALARLFRYYNYEGL